MAELNVLGFDPSLRHWGIAAGVYDTSTKHLDVKHLDVTEPVIVKTKQTRVNNSDLQAAEQLSAAAMSAMVNADAIFVEVPHGSQSARAMAGYGICIGVLGSLRASGTHFFELTEREVKLAALNKKTATKQEMIDWAMAHWPNANWPMYKQKGQLVLSAAKAEHMADACATIHAGIQSQQFQQLLQFNFKELQ
jgi:hypothetical protein